MPESFIKCKLTFLYTESKEKDKREPKRERNQCVCAFFAFWSGAINFNISIQPT